MISSLFDFTVEQQLFLEELRIEYCTGWHSFTVAQRNRLRFLRWLHRSGRLEP